LKFFLALRVLAQGFFDFFIPGLRLAFDFFIFLESNILWLLVLSSPCRFPPSIGVLFKQEGKNNPTRLQEKGIAWIVASRPLHRLQR